jgi:transketolase
LAGEISRRLQGRLPDGWKNALPRYTPKDSEQATRKLSQILLNKVAPILPELVGGSADLTGSNLTKWDKSVDFQPVRPKFVVKILLIF